jgi:ferritin-like metal-binding protein YciE
VALDLYKLAGQINILGYLKKLFYMKETKTTRAAQNGSKAKPKEGKETKSALEEFFVDELRDIYWAEKHLTKALPKMAKAATSDELTTAFEEHLEQTEEHVKRLEDVFEMMGETARAKKCEAMEGLVKEGESIIEDTEEDTATRDVGLIFAAQKIEHYEIATYGGLCQLARTIGRDDVAEVLKQTLGEEKIADEKLSEIAESQANPEASTEED